MERTFSFGAFSSESESDAVEAPSPAMPVRFCMLLGMKAEMGTAFRSRSTPPAPPPLLLSSVTGCPPTDVWQAAYLTLRSEDFSAVSAVSAAAATSSAAVQPPQPLHPQQRQ